MMFATLFMFIIHLFYTNYLCMYFIHVMGLVFQVVSFKLVDCDKAHYPKEIIQ